MAQRPPLKRCLGWSDKKGGQVGERHRWNRDLSGPGWGKGRCIWCHRDLAQLVVEPKVELTLEQAIARGEAEANEDTEAFDGRACALGKPQPHKAKTT